MRRRADIPGRLRYLLTLSGPGRRNTPSLLLQRLMNVRLSAMLHALLVGSYVTSIYVVVLALGGVSGQNLSVPWWLNATALLLIGLSLVPVSRWLRQRIEQLIDSWPNDPYGAMSQLQAHLLHNPSPQAIVPTVVATITATLNLPYAAITSMPDGEKMSIGLAPPGAELVEIPLTYGDTIVGSLEVAARRPGRSLSTSELQLLNDLARQVGITLHAAQLSDALQTSRAQLVAAREEERRRIRRDLHDGLGPTLASMRLQLGAARRSLRVEPEAAEALLDELRTDMAEATSAIRRLVYDLRPPMLDEHGLVGTLQSLSRLIEPATLRLELPATLPGLPAAVEVALYRIAAEALHNVARHARAESCTLVLEVTEEAVQLCVRDSGAGLAPEHHGGVGLTSMRERAEELGGSLSVESAPGCGVTVTARIPWRSTA